MILHILIFLASSALFYIAGRFIVKGLVRIAKVLGWREFVIAFVVMASAASLPNFIVGISAGLRHIPQLSFGDITGNNLVDLTLAIAIAAIFAQGGIVAESRMVLKSSWFVMVAAILPLLLSLDRNLSRLDGLILIALFVLYVVWLFSKKEQFQKKYKGKDRKVSLGDLGRFVKDIFMILLGIVLFIIAAQGIVVSAQFFAKTLNISLLLIGILITGLGSALPEIYFAAIAAKSKENWLVLGDLMGAIIIPPTMVLGLVALFFPIHISDLSSLALARAFLIITALMFPILIRSGKKISKKEAVFLLFIYIIFLISEIFFR